MNSGLASHGVRLRHDQTSPHKTIHHRPTDQQTGPQSQGGDMRARNIKPALFKNELLGEADPMLTILFEGLWCLADREGKLEDRSKRIKAEIFPYRDLQSINGYLTELERLGFIERYEANGTAIIKVLNFNKHQSPHKTEKQSQLPDRPENTNLEEITVIAPLDNGSVTDEAALIPDSGFLIPEREAPPPKRSKKPDADTVRDYMVIIGIPVHQATEESNQFVDHYTSNGWKVGGKSSMKDWKASVRQWKTRLKICNEPIRKTIPELRAEGALHES
jgi:hypothetical protein